MKCDKQNMLLYAVTDRAWVGKQTLYEQVESALKGGVTCVQLREKELDDEAFLKEAVEIHALCQRYGVPFFVNCLLYTSDAADDMQTALAWAQPLPPTPRPMWTFCPTRP